jgi:hypothetical protein
VDGNITNAPLIVGNNTITLTVTAEDGKTVEEYLIMVIREDKGSSITSAENTPVSPARIIPNPTNGLFTLNFDTSGNYLVSITTLAGKLLFCQTVSEKRKQIDVGSYPQGMYLVVVDDGKQKSVMKIVKEK